MKLLARIRASVASLAAVRSIRNIMLAALAVAAMCAFLGLQGCAAGRGPGGEVVIGFDVATLPETAAQAVGGLVGALAGGPWGTAATLVLGALGLGGTAYGAKRAGDAKAAREARDAADRAWDEASARTAATYQPPPLHPAPPLTPDRIAADRAAPGVSTPAAAAA